LNSPDASIWGKNQVLCRNQWKDTDSCSGMPGGKIHKFFLRLQKTLSMFVMNLQQKAQGRLEGEPKEQMQDRARPQRVGGVVKRRT